MYSDFSTSGAGKSRQQGFFDQGGKKFANCTRLFALWRMWLLYLRMCLKDVGWKANSADPDQTAEWAVIVLDNFQIGEGGVLVTCVILGQGPVLLETGTGWGIF